MESQTVLALKDNGGGHPNQKLQPEGRRGLRATNTAKLDSQIKTPRLRAQERAGGRAWAYKNPEKVVSQFSRIAANIQLLFRVTILSSMITGAVTQNLDGSCGLKTFATTNGKVAAGTIVAIVGTFIIAAWWMHSRRSAFTEADIMDGLSMGPAVAKRSDLTFEIHPSF